MKFPQLCLARDAWRPSPFDWLLGALVLSAVLVLSPMMHQGALLIASRLLDVLDVDHALAGDLIMTPRGAVRPARLGGGVPSLLALVGLAIFWGASMNRPWIRRVALVAAAAVLGMVAGAVQATLLVGSREWWPAEIITGAFAALALEGACLISAIFLLYSADRLLQLLLEPVGVMLGSSELERVFSPTQRGRLVASSNPITRAFNRLMVRGCARAPGLETDENGSAFVLKPERRCDRSTRDFHDSRSETDSMTDWPKTLPTRSVRRRVRARRSASSLILLPRTHRRGLRRSLPRATWLDFAMIRREKAVAPRRSHPRRLPRSVRRLVESVRSFPPHPGNKLSPCQLFLERMVANAQLESRCSRVAGRRRIDRMPGLAAHPNAGRAVGA